MAVMRRARTTGTVRVVVVSSVGVIPVVVTVDAMDAGAADAGARARASSRWEVWCSLGARARGRGRTIKRWRNLETRGRACCTDSWGFMR